MSSLPIRSFVTIVLSAAALLLVLSVPAVSQGAAEISITASLEPSHLEVSVGTTVTWTNDDGERHRLRSREGPEAFDSGNLQPGESFSLTFAVEGDYPYLDHRNDEDPSYYGSVTVVGSAGDGQDGPIPTSGTISIVDRAFGPASIMIATGGSVEWSNRDGEAHTVTSVDGVFDSGIVGGGNGFSVDFDAPGTYPYFCAIHPEMRGTVTVSDPTEQLAETGPTDVPVETGPRPGEEPELETTAGTATVSIIDRSFQPGGVEVIVGDTVSWSNADTEGHTVTANEGSFGSGVLTIGDGFSVVFDEPGTFDYFCAIHPDMTGSVAVVPQPEVPPESG